VGWVIDEYNRAQVSINLTNFNVTPPYVAFDECCKEAEKLGVRVTGSELVGLIPLKAVLDAGRHYLKKQNGSAGVPDSVLIETAVQSLGLSEISPFDPKKKIIEYTFKDPLGPLTSMRVGDFVDEVSMNSPAPGGGSISAVVGSMGAALSSMVANLTVGKKEYEDVWEEMKDTAEKAQELKDQLVQLVEKDTQAFNDLMDTFRLPKKSDEQKATRDRAVQEATKHASRVPLEVMETSLKILDLAETVVNRGNVNSVSDGGVGALAARMAVEGAGLNVKINLTSITDDTFVKEMTEKADALIQVVRSRCDALQKVVEEKIRAQ
jgi:glutamate formiminotransferase/formiminotetrahydrofolate cyclodeaminase